MLRWSEDQLREHHAKRQGRAEAMQEAKQHVAAPKRAKYGNKKVEIDGRVFDSRAEGARYIELKRLQEGGVISCLKCQESFTLQINQYLICRYIADFVYLDADGCRVVEDVKGVRTDAYILKKKLMKAIHGIDIKEITKVARRGKIQTGLQPTP